jgi:hypothetical protein
MIGFLFAAAAIKEIETVLEVVAELTVCIFYSKLSIGQLGFP